MGVQLAEKAAKYLTEGRVKVTEVIPYYAEARVQGSENYLVILRGLNDNSCTCPGFQHHRRCAHILAVRLVTDLKPPPHEQNQFRFNHYDEFNSLLGIPDDV